MCCITESPWSNQDRTKGEDAKQILHRLLTADRSSHRPTALMVAALRDKRPREPLR